MCGCLDQSCFQSLIFLNRFCLVYPDFYGSYLYGVLCQYVKVTVLLFIPYLDFAVKPLPSVISAIHYHKPLWSALDWIVDRDVHKITIDPKYADGISFVSSDRLKINQLEREIIAMQKRKSITYKKVKKMLGKNANISNHY